MIRINLFFKLTFNIFSIFLILSTFVNCESKATKNVSKLPIGKICTSNIECGQNAFCSPQQTCQCDFRFIPDADKINCTLFTCYSNIDCNTTFGNGTKCYNNQCICDESFQLNQRTQTCFTNKRPRNGNCNSDYDCGANNFCSKDDHQCKCLFGYLPSKFNNVNCDFLACHKNSDCQIFSPHAQCGIVCSCNTESGWALNQTSQACVPKANLLNQTCTFNSDCGSGTVCGDNKCRCLMSFLPDPIGGINCNLDQCFKNSDCARFDSHSVCHYGSCVCDTQNGWLLQKNNQTCRPRAVPIGNSCLATSSCGYNSDCINGACQCQFGFKHKSNGIDCQQVHCSGNTECSGLDENADCDLSESSCECKQGFHLKNALQRCVSDDKNKGPDIWVIFSMVIGFTFILFGLITTTIIIIVRRRNRQRSYIETINVQK